MRGFPNQGYLPPLPPQIVQAFGLQEAETEKLWGLGAGWPGVTRAPSRTFQCTEAPRYVQPLFFGLSLDKLLSQPLTDGGKS